MPQKKTYIGKVVEQEIDYGNSNALYHDVYIKEINDYLTQDLFNFEGKKVKVTVEVIEEDTKECQNE
ncbi:MULTISPECIES: hypothetical protein [Bacillus]|nr:MULTISPECIES: hypothetical protein [Bacillus]KRD80877.1 hypothetical protein ASE53_17675 [Bacillus sp. Root11]KRD85408.1 hypothetical protein ASE54_17680 [Bacillus sp. Root131]MCC4028092.1 hypothetical protein [Bacillus thuringiensis]NVO39900.1 hypothetical protein [Bacillus thuringiensis serovar israelensis]RCX38873.1 hypothetical protein DEU45_105102 [Bacillus sp. AG102]